MEEFKGTPGPWIADKTSRAVGPVSHDDDQSYGILIPVAWVEFDQDVGIQASNQRLIAAAPELLEALQDLESRACIYVNTSKANAAIKKALGIDKMTPEQERDEALKILKEVLENYQYNGRKGIGMGPLVRASKLLDKYRMFKELGEKQ